MKMNNRMNIKNIIKIFGIAVSVVCVLGCADLNKGKEQIENEGSYLLTGKISLPAESGAVPSLLNAVINNAGNSTGDSSARTATSSFTQGFNSFKGDFTVTATHIIPETGELVTKTCTVETSDDGEMTYSIQLPYTGEWTLEAVLWGYIDNSTTESIRFLTGSATIQIEEEKSILSKDILVNPAFASNTSGKISLDIRDETTDPKLYEIKVYELPDEDEEDYILDVTYTDEEDAIVIETSAGSHTYKICFYDSDGNKLYSCLESMVVYSGFVTDTWYGRAPHFELESGKCIFVLTDELLENQVNRGNLSIITTEDGLDTPYVLWSSTTCEGFNDAGTSEKEGLQIVSRIDENTTIDNPIRNLEARNPNFCFGDDGYVYFLENNCIKVCKESYSGYRVEETISFASIDSTLSGSNFSISSNGGPAYYNNSLYFYLSIYDSSTYSTTKYLCKIDLEQRTMIRIESKFTYNGSNYSLSGCLAVDCTDDNWTLYSKADSESYGGTGLLVKMPFTLTDTGITLASSAAATDPDAPVMECFELSETNFGVNKKLNVSDLQIKDNVLYVLTNYYAKADSWDNTPSISAGGILRFKLDEIDQTGFVPSDWSDGVRILGLYTESSGNTLEVAQPPLNQAEAYFYGPQRFVAIKPKELVIADDGAYIYSDTIASKNRVVKVNLEEESLGEMSVTDVNVTYTKSLTDCGGVYLE